LLGRTQADIVDQPSIDTCEKEGNSNATSTHAIWRIGAIRGFTMTSIPGSAQPISDSRRLELLIESELGVGTVLTLYLPRAQASSRKGVSTDEQSGETVLIIDDNPEAAATTASMLKQLGYAVHVVHDGNAALDAIERELRLGPERCRHGGH
jgi:hypothetical protein